MINANFCYNQENTIIKCNLEDKVEDVCRKFTSEKNLNNLKLYFLYGGSQVNLKSSINEIISPFDEEYKEINFIVEEIEPGFERTNSMASNNPLLELRLNNPLFNNPNDVLIPNEEIIDLNKKKKRFLMIIYLNLIIQFILIGTNVFLFLLFKYNNIFIANTQSMLWTLIPTSIFLIIIFPSFYFITKYFKDSITLLLIYNLLYIICMIFYTFLLSKFIKTEIILNAIILIVLDSFSLEIYIILFKSYNFFRLIILPIIINIASIILSYYFWIKDIYENIYLFSFGIFIIVYLYFTIHYISFKYCKTDEYFFALVITNLFVIAGFVVFIKFIFKHIIVSFSNQEMKAIKKYLLIINFILIVQFLGIYFIVIYTESDKRIDNKYAIAWLAFAIGCFAYFVIRAIKKNKIYIKTFFCGIIFFIPLIYAFLLFLHNFINMQYLSCALFLIISSLVITELCTLFFIIFNYINLILITMGITIIIIYFNFTLIHSFSSAFLILLASFIYFIYINVVINKLWKKYEGKEIIFSIACINYLLFSPLAIFFIVVVYIYVNYSECKWIETIPIFFSFEDDHN